MGSVDEEKSRAVMARYNSFVAKIVSYNLDKDAFLPPLLDVRPFSFTLSSLLTMKR
jgi:hypothetical protein